MSSNQESLEGVSAEAETSEPPIDEALGFGEALREIEATLARIEDDEVDIDELATALNRAAVLLELCRVKIRRAEQEVEHVSQRLVPKDDLAEKG